MINKTSKTALQFLLVGMLFVSVAFVSCNNESTENKVDTEKMMDEAPAPVVKDSIPPDSASQRPILPAN